MWIQRPIRHSLFRKRKTPVGWKALPAIFVVASAGFAACRESPKTISGADGGLRPATKGKQSRLGTVQGAVRVRGKLPLAPALRIASSVGRQCGSEVPDRTLIVDGAGGLADALVFIAEGDSPSAEPGADRSTVAIDQHGCEYWPPVVAARAGSWLEITNSDPLIHNVRAKSESTLFNIAMPIQGQRVRKLLPDAPGVVHLACDVHPWMRAVIRTFDHRFFAITDARGHYRLSLPSGRKKIVFWHQRFPEQSSVVPVPADQVAEQDAEWSAGSLLLAVLAFAMLD